MSKRLVLLACIVMIVGIVSAPAVFADIIINANESCRVDGDPARRDENRHDSSKLSMRTSSNGWKSWVKFDLGDLDVGNLETATLTVALNRGKAGNNHFDISCVNDDFLDNIDWDERSITWNNAPGNNTAVLDLLDPTKTTYLTTVNFTDGVAGDPFTIDVLEVLQADTDGIVQFVFHNSNNLQDLATHDHAQVTWRPFIDATVGSKGQAKKPYPAKGATDVCLTPILSWEPGEFAAPINGHKVYFGESFNDVNDGIGAITQSAGSYAPPQRLDFNKTYYWRVDEVSAPPDSTVRQGRVWSFTTEPIAYPVENITATASITSQLGMGPENTINGSGLDVSDLHSTEPTDMWLSDNEPNGAWIEYEFDKVHKLHEMWVWNSNQVMEPMFGLGCKDVTIEYSVNGTDYTTLGTTHEFARAPGLDNYAHNTTVDLNGVAAKYVRLTANSNWGGILDQYGLSEVRFFYIPILAREPDPDSGARDVSIGTIDEPIDVTLGFRAGREAARHDVYLSSDEQAVIDGTAPVATVTETSYGPLSLDLGMTYYWRVDEVNDAASPNSWEGDVWSFSTIEYFVVDDFEDYNDYPPDEIFSTWIDGYGTTTNGALIAHDDPPFAETTVVHGGRQSMAYRYDNNFKYSEATMTLVSGRDWTRRGVGVLSLWFYGDVANAAERMYVALNGSATVYHDNPDVALIDGWTQWPIDLQDFAAQGVNLANVNTVTIGFGDKNNLQAGGSGMVFFDDIRLYRPAPESEPAP